MSLNQPVGLPYQNPRDYVGPEQNIIPIKRFGRRPTTADKKYRIGQMALLNRDPVTGVEGELWYLARFESNGDATWLQLATGSSSPGIDFLQTDDGAPPVGPDVSGVVGILGGTGIVTSGQDPSTNVTIAVDGSVVGQTITGDSGGALSPTAGNWNIIGSTGVNTSGAGSTLTINLDGSVVTTQYDADSGSATPTAGVLNILGGNGTVTSASGNTVVCEMQSPFVGDFSFESNTGGATETFTVQNTVDAASSGALLQAVVAGSSSSGDPIVKVASTGQRAAAMSIDTASNIVLFQRSVDTSTTLSEEFMRVDGADAAARVLFNAPGGVAITGNTPAGGTALLHVINSNEAANSDVQILLQTGDPTVGAGGGSQFIRWGSSNQVQFSLGMGKDASATTQPLEFKMGSTFSAGIPTLTLHPGAELNITMNGTGAVQVPTGTTGERPATPVNGMIRYNITSAKFEGYEAGAWANLI